MIDERGEQLLRLIEDDPEEGEAFRAYGDWLEERGDPRSQLMGMQITRARLTDRNKLAHLDGKLTAYFEQHREHFLGPLAKVLPGEKSSHQARANAPTLEWRRGFIYKAEAKPIGRLTADQFLDRLLAHPSGRLLVELHAWGDPKALVAVLAARAPRSLRVLDLGAGDEALAALWPRIPLLRELVVSGGPDFGELDLPALRSAKLDLQPNALASLARANWPSLERFELQVWSEISADQIMPVLAGPNLRAIRLELGAALADVVRAIDQLPTAGQLSELVVPMTEESIAALERCSFQLDLLRLTGGLFTDPTPRLRHLAKQIQLG